MWWSRQLVLLVLIAVVAVAVDDWKFLDRYPRHYVSHKLSEHEHIVVDGRLDDTGWRTAPFSGRFVDITRHLDAKQNAVPEAFQAQVKIRWDSEFLYVGAVVNDPFVWANLTGHNTIAPYHDNDFEIFVDPSGTTEYYKEFEMSARNATYDVLWGVPDQWGLRCDASERTNSSTAFLPVCTNTSFPLYPGSWTMSPGMRTATYIPTLGQYIAPHSNWTLEIAFPLRANANASAGAGTQQSHGGLLDSDGSVDLSRFDPVLGDPAPGLPRYWWIDFARAEHPRAYDSPSSQRPVLCPWNCSDDLVKARPILSNPDQPQCNAAQAAWPTLLGNDTFYGCYWEWVWQDLGTEAYMHRPHLWGLLQFVDKDSSRQTLCKSIEHPGRYLAAQAHLAQRAYMAKSATYATTPAQLLRACTKPDCDVDALRLVQTRDDVFSLRITVQQNATVLSRMCTARPCYNVSITVSVPQADGSNASIGRRTYTASINENHLLSVQHHGNGLTQVQCL